MNTRTKLLTASGGVLLLAGVGGALALWSDSTEGDTLVAATGHLDITIDTDDSAVWDVSPMCQPTAVVNGAGVNWNDCTILGDGSPTGTGKAIGAQLLTVDEEGVPVALGTESFLMVPGDIVMAAVKIDVDLAGQNIAAKLDASLDQDSLLSGIDSDDSTASDQFEVVPIGIFEGATATLAGQAAQAAIEADQAANGTYYFVGDNDTQTVWAVYTVQFLNFTSDSPGDNGAVANDTNGISMGDLMDNGVGEISALTLLGAVKANLVQVRSAS
jgi:hypothetical protein